MGNVYSKARSIIPDSRGSWGLFELLSSRGDCVADLSGDHAAPFNPGVCRPLFDGGPVRRSPASTRVPTLDTLWLGIYQTVSLFECRMAARGRFGSRSCLRLRRGGSNGLPNGQITSVRRANFGPRFCQGSNSLIHRN